MTKSDHGYNLRFNKHVDKNSKDRILNIMSNRILNIMSIDIISVIITSLERRYSRLKIVWFHDTHKNIVYKNIGIYSMAIRVVEFSNKRGAKLERFLPKNQHNQKKLSNFENWVSGELSKSQKSPDILTFKVNFLCQKLFKSFSIFFHWRISI